MTTPVDRWPHRWPQATEPEPVLALAPMEGVSDVVVRRLLANLGGMDFCVSEFLRVTQHPLSASTLLKHVPELRRGGRTARGVPVQVQLLGSDPEMMAKSAETAIELGALAIDLNFGCPARRVNGHDGGAALLRAPVRLERVVRAVRSAVPSGIPVSTKIRLGFENPDDVFDVVRAAEAAGTDWITIHGRTKVQMYRPPADWHRIGAAAQIAGVPVVANGDIFGPEDLERCRALTGCRAFMLGRGAFRQPGLFRRLRDDPGEAKPKAEAGQKSRIDRLDGAGPDGAGPAGAGPDGAGPDGAGPDGAGPDGAGPDGAGPDGAGPDGAGPGRAREIRPDYPWSVDRRRALLVEFVAETRRDPRFRTPEQAALCRLKQWLRAMAEVDVGMRTIFDVVKRTQRLDDALDLLVNPSCYRDLQVAPHPFRRAVRS